MLSISLVNKYRYKCGKNKSGLVLKPFELLFSVQRDNDQYRLLLKQIMQIMLIMINNTF